MPHCSALVLVLAALAQTPPKSSDLVATQEGELPVILSAPHGGTGIIPDVPARKGIGLEKGGKGFFAGRDGGTEELLYAVADAIKAKTGKKPYFVAAKFARTYLDANRPPEIAYEDAAAKPTYDAYRGALADYCRRVQKAHGRGLLLDLHGQGMSKETIYRGTQNGATVALLRRRFGEAAHTGPKSLFGLLAAGGARVFPEVGSDAKEQPGFNGGHITRSYGGESFGIDAMQLEFGADFRSAARRKATAENLAAAIHEYIQLYLTDEGK